MPKTVCLNVKTLPYPGLKPRLKKTFNFTEVFVLLTSKWPPRHAHGDLTCLAPHERLHEVLIVPREKTPMGAAA